jgi:MFS family permease
LCATAGFVAIVFVNNAYLFWAPKFAAEKFAVGVGEAGKGVMLWHHLFAFAAILCGGVITDRFVQKMPRFRLGFQILALILGAPMLLWIGLAPSFTALLVAASAYGVFRGFFEVNTHASLFDVVAPAHRSTAVGLLNMIAFFFGGLSGVAMGALSQKWGVRGFEIGFGVMAAAYALGAALMAFSFFFTFRKDRVAE